jgi:hypothetical protein
VKLFSVFVAILALAGPIARAYPPSYDISSTAAAQDEARARKLPLAYLGIIPGVLTEASPQPNSDADLSQLALNTLQGRAVVITFDGRNMAPVPGLIHMQFHQPDDGPLQGGAAWLVPKIVFSDPGITKTLGRVSHTDLASRGAPAIRDALDAIQNDPTSLDPKPAPSPSPVAADDVTTTPSVAPEFGTVAWGLDLLVDRWQYFAAAIGLFVIALIAWAAKNL